MGTSLTTFDKLAEEEALGASILRSQSPHYVDFLELAVDALAGSTLEFEERRMLFEGFFIHAKKMARLTLMSALRQHRVQMNLNLRQLVEAISHFAFFAHNTGFPAAWAAKDASADDLFKSNEVVTRQVYRWIEHTYPEFSGDFVFYKRQLNRATAHASILTTGWMIDFEARKYADQFLDASSELDGRIGLHTAGQIVSLGALMVLYLNRDVGGFIIEEGLGSRLASLRQTGDRLRAEIANDLEVRS